MNNELWSTIYMLKYLGRIVIDDEQLNVKAIEK